jgi:type I restriction enzyme, S subunit
MADREYKEHEVEVLLREGALLINDGYRAKNSELSNTGIPFARAGNIDGGFHFEDADRVPAHTLAKVGLKRSLPGDVVFTSKGTVGRFAFVRDGTPEFVYSPQLCYWRSRDVSRIHPRWLYYWMNGRDFFLQFKGVAGQTDMAEYVSLRDQRAMKITLPPLAEQKAIAAVLGALDDKIELNRRMNATLEAMARALFQSWFVDFDPVRAKLDGRMPVGLDPATAALFPDSFQDSEAGHIPKGWTVGKVSDLATLNRGAINPGDFPSETFDHYSLPAFDNGRTPKVELGNAIMSNKFTVTLNSVLLSKLNPHIPRIWLPDLHASHRSVCSTEFMVACSQPGVTREYLFSIFTSSAFASIYGTLVTGTTGSHQRIRPDSVLGMKIVIPFAALIRAFTDIVKPMLDGINRNTDQSRTLATLRDTLLQKLLSGELSVGELNPITEADP